MCIDLKSTILLSIKPVYAESILSGKKTVEFRKANFPRRVGTLVLYATNPVKRIVGLAKVRQVVVLSPAGAWRRYRRRGAIDKKAFDAYYAGAKKAVCLELGKARRLAVPVDPKKVIRRFRAPLSYRYLMETVCVNLVCE
jgi:predicted transcriptional regulator